MKKLVTHNGTFHADDIFATAILSLLLESKGEEFEVIRTRDPETIESGDIVYDVGGIYDEEKDRFDHHQTKGAGARPNGIEYSSVGLVWKKYGLELCGGDEDTMQKIDKEIISPIDANDNGMDLVTPKFDGIYPYSGARPFLIFAPTWQETDENIYDIFINEVKNVKRVLKRELEVANADSKGRKLILDDYTKAEDKRIIELSDNFPRYLYQNTISKFEEPIYIVNKSGHNETWKVEAVQKSPETFESRKPFPESWRGLMNMDPKLIEMTGIQDIIFCHKSGFLAVVETKESAHKLAELALSAKS